MPTTRRTVAKATRKTAVRKTARPRVTEITVQVGRMGNATQSIKVSSGASVNDVLAKAGISLSSTDKVYIAGVKVSANSVVEHRDILSVIAPKAAGNESAS